MHRYTMVGCRTTHVGYCKLELVEAQPLIVKLELEIVFEVEFQTLFSIVE